MSKDIIKQLKQMKHLPEAGYVSDDVVQETRTRVLEAVQSHDVGTYILKDNVAFHVWNFQQFFSRQLVVATAAFVFILGGWMTSVNAASNSLPGDTFYSLKLATERARLKLASQEHRAVLHTEFARRRYEEALAIQGSDDRREFLETTYDAFREQINLANSNLEQLKDRGSEETIVVATLVDQKINELNGVISDAATQSLDEVSASQMADAREVTQKTEETAVNAIVETHERHTSEPNSRTELDQLFKKELTELRTREAFNLGRLSVIQGTIDANTEIFTGQSLPIGESLNVVEFNIRKTADNANQAMNFAAVGGYRAAFDIIREANSQLLNIERQLALVEIAILDAFNTPQNNATIDETNVVTDTNGREGQSNSESTSGETGSGSAGDSLP